MSTAASAGSKREAGRLTGSRFTFTLFMLAAISSNPAFAAELRGLALPHNSVVAQLILGTLQSAQICETELAQPMLPAAMAPGFKFLCPTAVHSAANSSAAVPFLRSSDLAACTAARAP